MSHPVVTLIDNCEVFIFCFTTVIVIITKTLYPNIDCQLNSAKITSVGVAKARSGMRVFKPK